MNLTILNNLDMREPAEAGVPSEGGMNVAILNNDRQRPATSESFLTRAPSLTVHGRCCTPAKLETPVRTADEPGAQESALSERAVRAEEENRELLKALAGSKLFKEYERAFTDATGLPLALLPVESFQLPFRGGRNEAPFCALMSRENRTCGACLRAQAMAAERVKAGPCTTVCYAGLCETVVPVRLGNRLIGFLRTGQVFQRKPSQQQFQRTVKLLTSWGVTVAPGVLEEAYFATRVVSREQHAAAVKLLEIFAGHLTALCNQIFIQRTNAESPNVTRVKDFIREHHAEDLSLSQVAKVANISPYYFCKLFKQATRLTFTQFLSRVRIESSKSLLFNPQLRISEIAYEVGFQSLTHFNRVFQKLLGQSPTQYRMKVLQNARIPLRVVQQAS